MKEDKELKYTVFKQGTFRLNNEYKYVEIYHVKWVNLWTTNNMPRISLLEHYWQKDISQS